MAKPLTEAQRRALENPTSKLHPSTRRSLINKGLLTEDGKVTTAGKNALSMSPADAKVADLLDTESIKPSSKVGQAVVEDITPDPTNKGVVGRAAAGATRWSDFLTLEEKTTMRRALDANDNAVVAQIRNVAHERMANSGQTSEQFARNLATNASSTKNMGAGPSTARAMPKGAAAQPTLEGVFRLGGAMEGEGDPLAWQRANHPERFARDAVARARVAGIPENPTATQAAAADRAGQFYKNLAGETVDAARSTRPDQLPPRILNLGAAEIPDGIPAPAAPTQGGSVFAKTLAGSAARPTGMLTPDAITAPIAARGPLAGPTAPGLGSVGQPAFGPALPETPIGPQIGGRTPVPSSSRALVPTGQVLQDTALGPNQFARTLGMEGAEALHGPAMPIRPGSGLGTAPVGTSSAPTFGLSPRSSTGTGWEWGAGSKMGAGEPTFTGTPKPMPTPGPMPGPSAASTAAGAVDDVAAAASSAGPKAWPLRFLGAGQIPGGGAAAKEAAAEAGKGRFAQVLAKSTGGLKGAGAASLAGLGLNVGGNVVSNMVDKNGDDEGFDTSDAGQFMSGAGTVLAAAPLLSMIPGVGWGAIGLGAVGYGLWNAVRGHGDSPEDKLSSVISAAQEMGLPWDGDDERIVRGKIKLNIAAGMSEDEATNSAIQEIVQAADAYSPQNVQQQMTPEMYMALQAQYQKSLADSQAYYSNYSDAATQAQLQHLAGSNLPQSDRTMFTAMTSAGRERNAHTAWASQLAALTAPTMQMYQDQIDAQNAALQAMQGGGGGSSLDLNAMMANAGAAPAA